MGCAYIVGLVLNILHKLTFLGNDFNEPKIFDSMGITYDDFAKLDIRVAKIISTERIPGKTKIIKGVIDLGDESRSLIIGGAQYFAPEELVGKTVIAITNLEPKIVGGVESNAMLLAADLNDKPYWLTVDSDVPAGTKIK
jgi:tRNA-binding protein